MGLVPLLSRDMDLTLLIVVFGQRRLRHAGFLNSASGCRDADLVSLRRSIALALLNVAFGKRSLRNASLLSFAFWSPYVDFVRLT